MDTLNFKSYMQRFEEEVIHEGVKRGIVGKKMQVNVREGRFACTYFARKMGTVLQFDTPFVIDYYGYLKRSKGFREQIKKKEEQIRNRQIKSIQTVVVFFASIKIEEIAEITANTYLKSDFPEFKKAILHWRGFEKENKDRPLQVVNASQGGI